MASVEAGQIQPFTFLDLPVEIRAMVFTELLVDRRWHYEYCAHNEHPHTWYVLRHYVNPRIYYDLLIDLGAVLNGMI